MRIPEFRVTSKGHLVKKVEWDADEDGGPIFDLTNMKVLEVKRVITPAELPTVQVTFVGRLVEVEEDDEVPA